MGDAVTDHKAPAGARGGRGEARQTAQIEGRDISLDPGADHWATLMRELDAALRRAILTDYDAFAAGRMRVTGEIAMRSEAGELRTTIAVRTIVPADPATARGGAGEGG